MLLRASGVRLIQVLTIVAEDPSAFRPLSRINRAVEDWKDATALPEYLFSAQIQKRLWQLLRLQASFLTRPF